MSRSIGSQVEWQVEWQLEWQVEGQFEQLGTVSFDRVEPKVGNRGLRCRIQDEKKGSGVVFHPPTCPQSQVCAKAQSQVA
jgi:hypothetical protein